MYFNEHTLYGIFAIFLSFANQCGMKSVGFSWSLLSYAEKLLLGSSESDCLPFMDVIERKKMFVNLGMFLVHGVRKWDGAKIIGFLSVGNKNVWVILILGEFMDTRHVWVHLSF